MQPSRNHLRWWSWIQYQWMVYGTSSWTDTTGANHAHWHVLQTVAEYIPSNCRGTIDFRYVDELDDYGTVRGYGSSTVCTISSTAAATDSCSGYADYDLGVTVPQAASSPPANTRWRSSAACTNLRRPVGEIRTLQIGPATLPTPIRLPTIVRFANLGSGLSATVDGITLLWKSRVSYLHHKPLVRNHNDGNLLGLCRLRRDSFRTIDYEWGWIQYSMEDTTERARGPTPQAPTPTQARIYKQSRTPIRKLQSRQRPLILACLGR